MSVHKVLSIGVFSTPTQTPLQAERFVWRMLSSKLRDGYTNSTRIELLFSTWYYHVGLFAPKDLDIKKGNFILNFSYPGLSDYVVKEK